MLIQLRDSGSTNVVFWRCLLDRCVRFADLLDELQWFAGLVYFLIVFLLHRSGEIELLPQLFGLPRVHSAGKVGRLLGCRTAELLNDQGWLLLWRLRLILGPLLKEAAQQFESFVRLWRRNRRAPPICVSVASPRLIHESEGGTLLLDLLLERVWFLVSATCGLRQSL